MTPIEKKIDHISIILAIVGAIVSNLFFNIPPVGGTIIIAILLWIPLVLLLSLLTKIFPRLRKLLERERRSRLF